MQAAHSIGESCRLDDPSIRPEPEEPALELLGSRDLELEGHPTVYSVGQLLTRMPRAFADLSRHTWRELDGHTLDGVAVPDPECPLDGSSSGNRVRRLGR